MCLTEMLRQKVLMFIINIYQQMTPVPLLLVKMMATVPGQLMNKGSHATVLQNTPVIPVKIK